MNRQTEGEIDSMTNRLTSKASIKDRWYNSTNKEETDKQTDKGGTEKQNFYQQYLKWQQLSQKLARWSLRKNMK
jgi:hypothetical protein